ncbi:MAG: polysaccharide deacetylase [Bryobacterales bacterium]|nr:polysaccharide deacetylase [Bryobacterales bacterium]
MLRRIKRWGSGGVLILVYHRITRLPRDPWSLCVSPEQFQQQLAVLRKQACPIPLRELSSHLKRSLLKKPRVAITFDDGYADNLHEAERLLSQSSVPATMFLISGAIRRQREFWWDELERVVFEPAIRGRPLRLDLRGAIYEWTAPPGSNGTRPETDTWQAWQDNMPTPAHQTYQRLYHFILPLPPEQRTEVMDGLTQWAGIGVVPRESHRPLSTLETAALARSPQIDIGVHTVTHPALATLDRERQAKEILDAKGDLEELTGRSSGLFAYPYGKRHHYNQDSISILRRSGFQYACAYEQGIANASTDFFQLPRVTAPALDGRAFASWLAHCFSSLP